MGQLQTPKMINILKSYFEYVIIVKKIFYNRIMKMCVKYMQEGETAYWIKSLLHTEVKLNMLCQ